MTQKERILKYINDFGSITALEAMRDLGIQQLGARIDGLQKDGYEFKKQWEQSKNRYGEPVSYKRYSVEKMVEENMNHIPNIL